MIESTLKLEGKPVKELKEFEKYLKNFPKTMLKAKHLKRVAEIVRKAMRKRITDEKQVGGGALREYMPNDSVGFARKKTRHKLLETGKLWHSIRADSTDKSAKVYIMGDRAEIGSWLHYGTKRMKPFNWWGLDETVERDVFKYLQTAITFDAE